MIPYNSNALRITGVKIFLGMRDDIKGGVWGGGREVKCVGLFDNRNTHLWLITNMSDQNYRLCKDVVSIRSGAPIIDDFVQT